MKVVFVVRDGRDRIRPGFNNIPCCRYWATAKLPDKASRRYRSAQPTGKKNARGAPRSDDDDDYERGHHRRRLSNSSPAAPDAAVRANGTSFDVARALGGETHGARDADAELARSRERNHVGSADRRNAEAKARGDGDAETARSERPEAAPSGTYSSTNASTTVSFTANDDSTFDLVMLGRIVCLREKYTMDDATGVITPTDIAVASDTYCFYARPSIG